MHDLSGFDLMSYLPDMKKIAGTNGDEFAGPCPLCGGEDRFRVWPNPPSGNPSFWCRKCVFQGDLLTLLMKRDGLTYSEALKQLSIQPPAKDRRPPNRSSRRGDVNDVRDNYPALTNIDWQASAVEFCERAEDLLWSNAGTQAREYLNARGISDSVMMAGRLGFNGRDLNANWGGIEVYCPFGITIPWYTDGVVWRVNIRQRRGREPKYLQPRGCAMSGFYRPYSINANTTVVLCEGEIDALTLYSEGFQAANIKPLATGSVGGGRALRWLSMLSAARRVLVAFDADDAGDQGAQWWIERLPNAARLRPEGAKDINDMLLAGADLRKWLEAGLCQ